MALLIDLVRKQLSPSRWQSAPEIAAKLGRSPTYVAQTLRNLHDSGGAHRREADNGFIWRKSAVDMANKLLQTRWIDREQLK